MALPVVILAGGVGTRVQSVTRGRIPKVMLPVAGRPFLDFKLGELARQGVDEVTLLVGRHHRVIERYIEHTPFPRMHVRCIADGPRLLGTGGALRACLPALPPRFWLTYGDSFLTVPMKHIEESVLVEELEGLMTVCEAANTDFSGNVGVDGDAVVAYDKRAVPGTYPYLDYGLLILSRRAVERLPAGAPFDLEEVFRTLINRRRLKASIVREPFFEIGTPEALSATDAYFRENGVWEQLTSGS